jgi:sec-independent protein translocase protein TatA
MMTGWTSPTHLVMLFVIVLLLFGAKRLPEIGRSLGSGMREFKNSVTTHGEDKEPAQLTSQSDAVAETAAVKEGDAV